MFVLLSRAKKNVGDFLITARARQLLERYRPEQTLVEHRGWEPLPEALVREADAIIIAGGPGFQHEFHPKVYPLIEQPEKLPCPLVPLGVGWSGRPGDDMTLEEYGFSPHSLEVLKWVSQTSPSGLGCRDHLTLEVLRRAGIQNAVMTGCPVWYSLDSIGIAFKAPRQVKRVVFTPPQDPLYHDQSMELALGVARQFPRAEKICAFHRGIDQPDRWMTESERDNNRRILGKVQTLGYQAADVSGDASKLAFYDDCDLHVGYRVHAHIYFLSKRNPSLLVHEDGRGRGASLALGLEGVDGFRRTRISAATRGLRVSKLVKRARMEYRASHDAASRTLHLLEMDQATRFSRFAGIAARIDAQLEVMGEFIRRLPAGSARERMGSSA